MTHDEQALHFQSCGGGTPDCDCENKRKILKGMLLRRRTHFSARSRCFKVPPSPDLRIESTNSNTVLYEEFRGIGHPSSIPQAPFGQIGDIYVDLTPGNHQLYAKTSPLEWIPWPGPSVPFDDEIHHPLYPDYTLTYRLSQGFGQGQDISGLGWYSSSYTHKSRMCDASSVSSHCSGLTVDITQNLYRRNRDWGRPISSFALFWKSNQTKFKDRKSFLVSDKG